MHITRFASGFSGQSSIKVSMLACALLVACSAQRPAPPAAVPPAAANEAAAVPEPDSAQNSHALTVNGYKKDAALWIASVNRQILFQGVPPPVLKSVVVLSIVIDALGQPTHVAVMRSNGYTELEKIAVQSVYRSAPLPHPNRLITRHGVLEYTETWLFRDDGRFQIRTLAQPQAST